MARLTDSLIVAGFAFVGGYVFGVMSAPRSGADSRERLASRARHGGRWIEEHLREIEDQLQGLEETLSERRRDLGNKVKSAASKAVDHYVPSASDPPDNWTVADKEITRDLPKLPRR